MPVEMGKDKRGKLRTYVKGTTRVALNTLTGKPLDGGGWKDTPLNRGKAERQSGYINEAEQKKERRHGRIS